MAGLAALGSVFGLGGGPAQAAPSSTLVYSVDGTNWSGDVTALTGQKVFARIFYDNDTTSTIPGVSVTTAIPPGFTYNANTTFTCIAPDSTPTAPTSSVFCGGVASDAAVWSGGNLTISPTAGNLGNPTTATVGDLEIGMKRYLNLHQCNYYGPTANDSLSYMLNGTPNIGLWGTGTNVSNTPDTSLSCGPGQGEYTLQAGNSGFIALDLWAGRYLNMSQCVYYGANTDAITHYLNQTAAYPFLGATTYVSNTPATAPSCQPGGAPDYPLQDANSGVVALDLYGVRYLNLHQCNYYGSEGDSLTYVVPDTPNIDLFGTGTNSSNTPETTVRCAPGFPGYDYQPGNSGVQALDLLDTSRGKGFVQFSMNAPSPTVTTTYPETAGTTGGVTTSDTGTITVFVDPIPLADPAVTGAALLGVAGAGWFVARHRRRKAMIAAV